MDQEGTYRIAGLYAISPAEIEPGDMLEKMEKALQGGVGIVQLRAKNWNPDRSREVARQLRDMTRRHGALFFVNDDVELARSVNADGVHLGILDGDWSDVAQIANSSVANLVGVSCYNDLDRAWKAKAAGASYVAFGSVYPSKTKPHAARASLEIIREARTDLNLPIVAIGGIEPENASAVVGAGADALAVINGLFGSQDIEATARAYMSAFRPRLEETESTT